MRYSHEGIDMQQLKIKNIFSEGFKSEKNIYLKHSRIRGRHHGYINYDKGRNYCNFVNRGWIEVFKGNYMLRLYGKLSSRQIFEFQFENIF